ncbi:hypothetical protein HaLaN_18609, partial [Haematococcus lacustris]
MKSSSSNSRGPTDSKPQASDMS